MNRPLNGKLRKHHAEAIGHNLAIMLMDDDYPPMRFGLDQKYCSVVTNDQMIDVAVFELDVMGNYEPIHRQLVEFSPNLHFCLSCPRIPAYVKPARLWSIHT